MIELEIIFSEILLLLVPEKVLSIDKSKPFSDRFDTWVYGSYPFSQKQLKRENYYLSLGKSWNLSISKCKLYYSRKKTDGYNRVCDKVNFLVYDYKHTDGKSYHFIYLLKYMDLEGNCLLDKFKKVKYRSELLTTSRLSFKPKKVTPKKKNKSTKLVKKTVDICSDPVEEIERDINEAVDILFNSNDASILEPSLNSDKSDLDLMQVYSIPHIANMSPNIEMLPLELDVLQLFYE